MAPENIPSPEEQPPSQASQADIDAFFAKIDVLRVQNEARGRALVRSWMTPETRQSYDAIQQRTKEEIDTEDARMFNPQPLYLGVGAEASADFLASQSQSGDRKLRQKLLPSATLTASKKRSEEEKEGSKKRALGREYSDDEEGRSALGGKKQRKAERETNCKPSPVHPIVTLAVPVIDNSEQKSTGESMLKIIAKTIDHLLGPVDGNILEGEKKEKEKKKKNKKKRKRLTNEPSADAFGVEVRQQNAITDIVIEKNEHSANEDTANSEISNTAAAHGGMPEYTHRSKEQRKADKKARKQERRRLKALVP